MMMSPHSRTAAAEYRQAEILQRQLARLRQDHTRRVKVGRGGYGRPTRTTVRRRELNTQIIHHLANARRLHEQETTP